MRDVHEAAGAIFPASVSQLAAAVGCSRSAIYRAVYKRQLKVDPDAVPLLIVGGVPPEPARRNYRCPFTPDMFDGGGTHG